jgi:hypothetical protein
MKKKTPLPSAGRSIRIVRPIQTSRPTPVTTGAPGIGRVPSLAPPLERALTQFVQELRKELAGAEEQIRALQTELTALRERYEGHTHAYIRTATGSGGNLWFNLGDLKYYIDEEKEDRDNWGIYFRESAATGSTPEVRTGPPSPWPPWRFCPPIPFAQ